MYVSVVAGDSKIRGGHEENQLASCYFTLVGYLSLLSCVQRKIEQQNNGLQDFLKTTKFYSMLLFLD